MAVIFQIWKVLRRSFSTFLKDEDWKVGTLDGFDDILYGYEGEIIWKNPKSQKKI
jgi:hypothetical protein